MAAYMRKYVSDNMSRRDIYIDLGIQPSAFRRLHFMQSGLINELISNYLSTILKFQDHHSGWPERQLKRERARLVWLERAIHGFTAQVK